jgi:N-acetylmuramoyl-L-alanine amidase
MIMGGTAAMNKRIKLLILFAILLIAFPYQAWAYKIVVDAGHGGRDPGAIGVNGLQEKFVNLDITLKLRDILLKQGYEVILTRDDDRFLSLAERVDFTNQQNADLFVSIHANSYSSSSTKGSMVLYYDDAYPQEDYPASEAMKYLSPYSKELAQQVLDSMVRTAGTVNKGLVPSAVYVARMGSVPSILVETGFLSNASDAASLADDPFRSVMAEGIGEGITQFKPPVFVDTIGHWAREAILRMKVKGLLEGINNSFQPNRALTRAEFVTIMDRMFDLDQLLQACSSKALGESVTSAVYGCKEAAASHSNKKLKDLHPSHWAYETMTKALKLNLIQGYSDGTLRPDQSITRAEVAVLFRRLMLASTPASVQTKDKQYAIFNDVPAQMWFSEAIYALQEKGIINGITDTEFMPNRSITRAEIAVMMDRYNQ